MDIIVFRNKFDIERPQASKEQVVNAHCEWPLNIYIQLYQAIPEYNFMIDKPGTVSLVYIWITLNIFHC